MPGAGALPFPCLGGSLRRKEPSLVPEELGPYAALAEEWCKRKLAESPRWSPDKWRRFAAIHGIEFVTDDTRSVPVPPAESGRDAA
ncbi:hypothetical protein GCM10027612_59580 [Microbispora bryophytorum subsp. camponoti]